jgi:flagellar secretion chaperone FliS
MFAEDQYIETKVTTATPWQLHLMVVDAAIRKAVKAQQALESRNFETAHFALNDSRDCITELIGGLNAEHQRNSWSG